MKEFIKDAEYESIRAVMTSRGAGAGQLPCKTVAFIPADRADRVLALDERLQQVKRIAPPVIVGLLALLSFLAGKML